VCVGSAIPVADAAQKFEELTIEAFHAGLRAGLPALTVPIGFTPEGLPVGLELLGTPLGEPKLLQFAHSWERAARPRKAPVL
jgi:Asp-tRNA(Asn)/Glu-tRNA(Gln) amidotransferase A subunit family amidase